MVAHGEARDALADALEAVLDPSCTVERPETGINLVVSLDGGPDDRRVVEKAMVLGVRPAPISAYYRDGDRRNGLLVGFASLPRARARWAAGCVKAAIDAARG